MFIGFASNAYGQSNHAKKTKGKNFPNIIYIYADDLGFGELGAYGQQKIKTPNLDRMAAEGMRFTQHYAGAPVCAPSRAILLTGLHAGHVPIRGNFEYGGFADSSERGQQPLPAGSFTVADLLKKQGYATGLVGKWGLGMSNGEGDPQKHGFDYFYGILDQKQAHNFYPSHLWENGRWDSLHQPEIFVHRPIDPATATQADFDTFKGPHYSQQKITEKGLAFLEKNRQQPFFLYMAYSLPHISLQVPDEWVNRYKGQFDEEPYFGQHGYSPHQFPMSAYAAMISYLDAQVGLVLEKIKTLGLDDNTLIMFSSDNGPTFNKQVDTRFFHSTGGLRGLKMDLFEGGIRVPFIARWPGKIAQGVTDTLISTQYDILATLADLTRQKTPPNDGVSFLPTLLGKPANQKGRTFLYFEYPENGGQIAIRLGPWKGVKTQLIRNPAAPWQLFHLPTDPQEKKDRANENPDVLNELDAIFRKEHQKAALADWQFAEKVLEASLQQ